MLNMLKVIMKDNIGCQKSQKIYWICDIRERETDNRVMLHCFLLRMRSLVISARNSGVISWYLN